MAFAAYDLTPVWNATARFTAASTTSMEIVNPMTSGDVHYVITDSDVIPILPVQRAARVRANAENKVVTLLSTERLWLASEATKAVATINY